MTQDHKYWEQRSLLDQKRDWDKRSENWIEDYRNSIDHPHRWEIIKELIKLAPFESILEIGCNAGPNLAKINYSFPNLKLAGIDANYDAIRIAKKWLPKAHLQVGNISEGLNLKDKEYDILLSDAVLIYIPPDNIEKVFEEIDRVTKKAVILIEWFDESILGSVKDFHWARNYTIILETLGFTVFSRKLTKEEWPSFNWEKNGHLFVATRNDKDLVLDLKLQAKTLKEIPVA